MGHRVWQGALAGSVAAIMAWVISYPFLPVKIVSADPGSFVNTVESHYSLGTFYGWFSNGLFGLLASFCIVFVYTGGRPLRKRIQPLLATLFLGPILLAAGDALSDFIGISLDKDFGNVSSFGLFVASFTWPLFLTIALCSSITLSLGKRTYLLQRWLIAVGISTFSSYVLHRMVDIVARVIYYRLVNGNMPINRWEVSAPSFLATYVAIGIVAGACLAIADIAVPGASITMSLGKKEGSCWNIDRSISIGVGELVDVRIPRDGQALPVHARIEILGTQYMLSHLAGRNPTLVNNVPIQKLALQNQDVIRIGQTELVFHIRDMFRGPNRRFHVDALYQAAVGVDAPFHALEYSLIDPLGNVHRLMQGRSIIGKGANCAISLSWESTITSVHAELNLVLEDLTIRDLGSAGGTKVSGVQVGNEPVPIKAGDVLELGAVKLRVESNRPLL